jgi:DNA-directed RNA polymerase specialized sigma24 family protein
MSDVATKEELREALEAATAFAVSMTRSKARADDLVQQAFEAFLTGERSWQRDKLPFKVFLIGAVRSMLSHERRDEAGGNGVRAEKDFQRDIVGKKAPSPEAKTLERAEEEGKQTAADATLDAIDAALGDNETARAVLRCRGKSEVPMKAGAIAKELELPVDDVYRANELIKDHARKSRAKTTKTEE